MGSHISPSFLVQIRRTTSTETQFSTTHTKQLARPVSRRRGSVDQWERSVCLRRPIRVEWSCDRVVLAEFRCTCCLADLGMASDVYIMWSSRLARGSVTSPSPTMHRCAPARTARTRTVGGDMRFILIPSVWHIWCAPGVNSVIYTGGHSRLMYAR